ncbi:MAG TPA: L-rhamnose mutarotase [Puia sp.]|nr:L-rhamnose mutarotase [Puia sp.]
MKRYSLTVDLKDDVALIAEYEACHKAIWPEIRSSILAAGITDMQIFRLGTRLFMIMETKDDFSFEKKAAMDLANPKVQEWEQLMWKFQQPMPGSKPGEKWLLMKEIFSLNQSI